MNAAPDHSESPAPSNSALDRWNTLWEPAARRYQPILDHPTPASASTATPSPEATAQL
ncbi:hypothetical protein MOD31_21175 [Paenarthrobacter sp. TYUT067]|uniref:hypothetical protein n=1 Tax=Paenarthrobacter sp. TYUT067 TaxID=2926245 RepID=UPI00202DE043|nr:hypothetical protein [Paenarthrobacter sp. TYUT067]MCM0618543.1 hypothetical protein [Paenarthrobacter sp. TYUT067]